jgi:hypothetical protein
MQHSTTKHLEVVPRLKLLTLLSAAIAMLIHPSQAGYCYGYDNDYSTSYLGLSSAWTYCASGTYNPGCGYGCVEAFAGKYLIL